MANNRMFLTHKPTRERILLAKNMGAEWYTEEDVGNKLNEFFSTSYEDNETDYIIEYENNNNTWEEYGTYVYFTELQNLYKALETCFKLSKEHNFGFDTWVRKALKDLKDYIDPKEEE